MMPKSGGMFYRQANRIAPFAGRGLGRPPRSHRGLCRKSFAGRA